jgi:hypothetical protein
MHRTKFLEYSRWVSVLKQLQAKTYLSTKVMMVQLLLAKFVQELPSHLVDHKTNLAVERLEIPHSDRLFAQFSRL